MSSAWLRLGLRARLLLIGLLGVAAALAIGSFALYGVLTVVSFRALDASSAATAKEVVQLVDTGRLPDPIPVTGSQIVQVLDAQNRVVSASVNADRLSSMVLPSELSVALRGSHPSVPGSRVGLDGPLRITALPAGQATARRTVVVAQEYDAIEHSQRTLGVTLLTTYPLLLAVLAFIAWRVIGAALRPVETLRSSAERISGTGQESRLPVPASRDEVHALAVTLNSMLDRLEASRSRQRTFVADAAHELRSPLASMRTQIEVAERRGEGTPLMVDVQAEVTRMASLVEDLLVLARLDSDTPREREPRLVDLGPVVSDVVRRHAGARVPVTADVDPDLQVLGHRDELSRVLGNLVDNAVRHADTGVRVSAEATGGNVDVTVTDDGAGIPEPDRQKVLDRFTRLDDARDRDAGGSGLGLAIVRELVQRSGGSLALEDAPGGGLVVHVVLPRSTSGVPA
jgi:signal transduction histidine kinase